MMRGKTPQQRSRGERWLGRGEQSSALISSVWLTPSSEIAASWQISTCSKSVTAHLPSCLNQKLADGAKGGERWEVARQESRGKSSRSSRTGADMPGMGFLLCIFFEKEHFLWQQQLQQHPNCTFEWCCQVAQGYAGFMELKHNILSFSEVSGLAKYNTNLRVRKKKKREATIPTMNQKLSANLSRNSYCFPLSIFHNHCKNNHIKFQCN